MKSDSMVEPIVERIHEACFRAAESEWRAIIAGNDAKYLTEADYQTVIEAWMDSGEVRRARKVFDACPFKSEEMSLLEWEILDAEEAITLGESVYPAGLPMSERWVLPSFVPDRERVVRWMPGRFLEVYPTHISLVVALGESSKTARVFRRQFSGPSTSILFAEEIDIVFSSEVHEDTFFIAVRYKDEKKVKLYPVICDEAPWNTGRREAARQADMNALKKWANKE